MKAALKFLLFFGFSLFFLLTPQVLADAPVDVSAQNYLAPQNGNYALDNFLFGTWCELTHTGIPNNPNYNCVGNILQSNGSSKLQVFNSAGDGGVVGGLTNVMLAMYNNPPASAPDYMANIGARMGFVPVAYAQVTGSGTGVITPVENLWEATRNLAYLAFIIVFVVVGLMIMFRQKINPQTVVSIQSALPGLVVGLILVTFSYFIAALLIDLSFVGVQLVAQLFGGLTCSGNPCDAFGNAQAIQGLAQNSSIFDLFKTAAFRPQNISDVAGGIFNVVYQQGAGTAVFLHVVFAIIGGIIGTLIVPGAGTIIGAVAGGTGGPLAVDGVLSLIIPLILVIALFIQMFRLLFQLLNSYIQLLIYTIGGPFFILVSSMPGRGGVLANWWRCLLGNSLVFPAVFGAFMFAGLILGSGNWSATLPLFAGIGTNVVRLFVAYGIILGTPALPPMVRQMMGCKGPETYGQAAVAGYRSGIGIVTTGGNAGWKRFMERPNLQREAWLRSQQAEIAEGRATTSPFAGAPVSTSRWGRLRRNLQERYVTRGTAH